MAIKSMDELSEMEKLSLIEISYSRLNTLDMCPAKYFYSYIIKEPQVFGEAATLGNILHSVLEDNNWNKELDLKNLATNFYEQRKLWDSEKKIADNLIEDGYHMLSELVDRHQGEKFDVFAVEMPFSFVLNSAYISGYIDRVDRTSTGFEVWDYKSGRREVAQKNVAQDLQLGTYALAASLLFPAQQKFRANLYYLRSGRVKGYTFTREELTEVEERLAQKIEELIDTDNFHYTSNTRICSFCDYNTICPVGQRRVSFTNHP